MKKVFIHIDDQTHFSKS